MQERCEDECKIPCNERPDERLWQPAQMMTQLAYFLVRSHLSRFATHENRRTATEAHTNADYRDEDSWDDVRGANDVFSGY
jgi:hypothetical protein